MVTGSAMAGDWNRSEVGGRWKRVWGVQVVPSVSFRGLSGEGVGRGSTRLWASKEGPRTLGQIFIFFDILPQVVWERLKFIYHQFMKVPFIRVSEIDHMYLAQAFLAF